MAIDTTQPYMLSMDEVATVLAMPRSTIYGLASEGRLPFPVERLGKALRVRRADVESFIENDVYKTIHVGGPVVDKMKRVG